MPLPDDGWFTPSDRAKELRAAWGVPAGPIDSMVDLLEAHGVPCLERDVTSARVDGISSWPDDAPPVILLGSHAPADRLRFTIAHELGHGPRPTSGATSRMYRFPHSPTSSASGACPSQL